MLLEIENYLKTQNLIPVGYCIFKGAMTDTVKVNGADVPADKAICLYNNTGFEPTLTFDNSNVEYPGLQIICRGLNYDEVEQIIKAIYKKLHGNTDLFGLIKAEQSPVSLGQDDKKRWEHSVNFKIINNM